MHVPMEVDHFSGSEPEDEDWEDVDEVRRESMCFGMMAHFSREIVEGQAMGRGKSGCRSKGFAKGKKKTVKGTGKKGTVKFGGSKGGTFGRTERLERPRTVLDTSHVDGKSLALMRRCRQPKKRRGQLGGSVDRRERGGVKGASHTHHAAAQGADPRTGQAKIVVMNHVKFVKLFVTNSVKCVENNALLQQ